MPSSLPSGKRSRFSNNRVSSGYDPVDLLERAIPIEGNESTNEEEEEEEEEDDDEEAVTDGEKGGGGEEEEEEEEEEGGIDGEEINEPCPLPGYGDVDCRLCSLLPREMGGVTEILKEVTRKYHEFKSRSKKRILIREFRDRLNQRLSEEPHIVHLQNVTVDEIATHLEEDHDRKRDEYGDPADVFRHSLVTALEVQGRSLCDRVQKGRHAGRKVLAVRNFEVFLKGVQVYMKYFGAKAK